MSNTDRILIDRVLNAGILNARDAIAAALTAARQEEREAGQQMADAAEMLWVVLANVSGSDWQQQSEEWQRAAARWRDNYHVATRARTTGGETKP